MVASGVHKQAHPYVTFLVAYVLIEKKKKTQILSDRKWVVKRKHFTKLLFSGRFVRFKSFDKYY